LLERLLRRLYGAIREEMEHTSRMLERIEQDIFSGHERDTVHAISDAARILQRFQTTLTRHEEPLDAFLEGLAAPAFFGKGFADHAMHISGEREHVADLVRSYRAVASELRSTNDSLLNAGQNEIVKRLTVMAFLVSPITVLASLFSLSVVHIPFAADPNAFWLIILIGIVISAATFTFFKTRRWI
jgi:magnesium transporter